MQKKDSSNIQVMLGYLEIQFYCIDFLCDTGCEVRNDDDHDDRDEVSIRSTRKSGMKSFGWKGMFTRQYQMAHEFL